MKKIKLLILSAFCFIFSGCSNNSLDYYSKRTTKVDFKSFFNGDIEGWGSIFDYSGRQTRGFYLKLKGTWDDSGNGLMEEVFAFDDGEILNRKWEIKTDKEKNILLGKADDVIGNATVKQSGNAIKAKYTLRVPYNNSTIDLCMDDWMYLIKNENEEVILNKNTMKKFGFKVGEIIIFMKKAKI